MTQLPLFEATVASPWCLYEGVCARKGRAEVGAWRQEGPNARNRPVVCVTCGRHGEESQNLLAGPGNRRVSAPGEVAPSRSAARVPLKPAHGPHRARTRVLRG